MSAAPTLGPCHCRPGVARDNCPDCEGTGKRIDFRALRALQASPAASVTAPTPTTAELFIGTGREGPVTMGKTTHPDSARDAGFAPRCSGTVRGEPCQRDKGHEAECEPVLEVARELDARDGGYCEICAVPEHDTCGNDADCSCCRQSRGGDGA